VDCWKEGTVARLTGVGGRESRRQAHMDVFTASCQASNRTLFHAQCIGKQSLTIS
jgi:hypothetical protein